MPKLPASVGEPFSFSRLRRWTDGRRMPVGPEMAEGDIQSCGRPLRHPTPVPVEAEESVQARTSNPDMANTARRNASPSSRLVPGLRAQQEERMLVADGLAGDVGLLRRQRKRIKDGTLDTDG